MLSLEKTTLMMLIEQYQEKSVWWMDFFQCYTKTYFTRVLPSWHKIILFQRNLSIRAHTNGINFIHEDDARLVISGITCTTRSGLVKFTKNRSLNLGNGHKEEYYCNNYREWDLHVVVKKNLDHSLMNQFSKKKEMLKVQQFSFSHQVPRAQFKSFIDISYIYCHKV